MRLVFKTSGHGVGLGTKFKHEDGKTYTVVGIEQPRHAGSTGRVSCETEGDALSQSYYPSVWGMEFIEREDRATEIKLGAHAAHALIMALQYASDIEMLDQLRETLAKEPVVSITLSIVTR